MIPLPMTWNGESMTPLPRSAKDADRQFVIGEVYRMAPVEERSEVSHNHEFAWLKVVWETLPEEIAADFPSPEHLRKRALIATGWCTTRDYVCASKAEAQRLCATLRSELDPYTVIIPRDAVVRVCRARSQSKSKMKKAEFQASKTAIIEWISDLIGATPEQVRGQGAGGAKNPARVAA